LLTALFHLAVSPQTSKVLRRDFVKEYVPKVQQAIFHQLLEATQVEMKKDAKTSFKDVSKSLKALLGLIMPPEEIDKVIEGMAADPDRHQPALDRPPFILHCFVLLPLSLRLFRLQLGRCVDVSQVQRAGAKAERPQADQEDDRPRDAQGRQEVFPGLFLEQDQAGTTALRPFFS
jgi:hypothetical protein